MECIVCALHWKNVNSHRCFWNWSFLLESYIGSGKPILPSTWPACRIKSWIDSVHIHCNFFFLWIRLTYYFRLNFKWHKLNSVVPDFTWTGIRCEFRLMYLFFLFSFQFCVEFQIVQVEFRYAWFFLKKSSE